MLTLVKDGDHRLSRPEDIERLRAALDGLIAEATAIAIAGSFADGVFDLDRFRQMGGLYHLTAAGRTTWHGFAQAILQNKEGVAKLSPIPTAGYPTPARRPQNSVLDNSKFGRQFGFSLPDWNVGLRLCLEELDG